jgi:hypothetical protein
MNKRSKVKIINEKSKLILSLIDMLEENIVKLNTATFFNYSTLEEEVKDLKKDIRTEKEKLINLINELLK